MNTGFHPAPAALHTPPFLGGMVVAFTVWSHAPDVPQPTPKTPPVLPEIPPDIEELEFPDTPTPPIEDPPPQPQPPQPIIGFVL